MTENKNQHLEWIFKQLKKFLLKDLMFTKQGINRTNLACSLHTNEKYLSKAVRIFGDQSIKHLILTMRIDYARYLLIKQPNYTIDAIASECGIGSRSTFYRIFKDFCGCSPCDYRKDLYTKQEQQGKPETVVNFSFWSNDTLHLNH